MATKTKTAVETEIAPLAAELLAVCEFLVDTKHPHHWECPEAQKALTGRCTCAIGRARDVVAKARGER